MAKKAAKKTGRASAERSPRAGKRAKEAAAAIAPEILRRLRKHYGEVGTALRFETPFELLVATILSAQCTDDRVNLVTPQLFGRYPTAPELAAAEQPELEKIIYSTGFYRNKAKSLIAMAQGLVADHGGEVPEDLPALVELRGVARKTANLVLGSAFGISTGVVVDTHVARLSRLLGLSAHEDPVEIEQDLMAQVPKRGWIDFGNLLILHGRRICVARRPACGDCVLSDICPSASPAIGGRLG